MKGSPGAMETLRSSWGQTERYSEERTRSFSQWRVVGKKKGREDRPKSLNECNLVPPGERRGKSQKKDSKDEAHQGEQDRPGKSWHLVRLEHAVSLSPFITMKTH